MSWTDDIEATVAVDPHLVLTGRTDDLVFVQQGDRPRVLPLVRHLRSLAFASGSHYVALIDPTWGFRLDVVDAPTVPPGAETIDRDRVAALLPVELRDQPGIDELATGGIGPVDAGDLEQMIVALSQVDYRGTLIVADGGRWIVDVGNLEDDEHQLFRTSAAVARASVPRTGTNGMLGFNSLWWLCQDDTDLPAWYVADPCVRLVSVSGPTRGERTRLGAALLDVEEGSEEARNFSDETDGLYVRNLPQIATMVRSGRRLHEAATLVRLGVTDDPWTDPDLLERLRTGRNQLGDRVVGQDHALDKAWTGLTRSLAGLNGAHRPSSGRRPRLVLFLAGPTGVGKTELAKAIAELIFGDADAVLRFDMSNYKEAHTAQGLIGSPAGYVGHEAGGILTNQVRERPFSVILFDEIDKADGRILDTFLQVLDEGHLDDGRGVRTYFDQSVIIFTSNLGIVDAQGRVLVDDSMASEVVRSSVEGHIKQHFTVQLGRPEIFGRMGDAFTVFDFIRSPFDEQIFDIMVRNLVAEVRDRRQLSIEFDDAARLALRQHCCADLSMGGRGIGNAVEAALLNPLSRWTFDQMIAGEQVVGRTARIQSWSVADDQPQLGVEWLP